MHIAVLIPARYLNEILLWTLEGYAQQVLKGHALEILVGIDGPTGAVAAAAASNLQSKIENLKSKIALAVHQLPRMGAAAVRNRLAERTDAELLIFGNADARPDADMVQQHADAMAKLPGGGTNHMVLGDAPWDTPQPPATPTIFDALLAETPMVFFYNQLKAGERYDFRHAWTLNLSIRAADFRRIRGFPDTLRPVYYEDLALGYRLLGPTQKAILYHPQARVLHRHPTTLDQYLDREELLGLMAPVLAQTCPEAFTQIFKVAKAQDLAPTFQTWTQMDAPTHRFTYQRLKEWATQPQSNLPQDPQHRHQLLMTIYQMHIPLKRLAFRLGYLQGLNLTDDSQWQSREPRGLWKAGP